MDTPVNKQVSRDADLRERLYARLDIGGPDECWEWQGHARDDQGKTIEDVGNYGRLGIGDGRTDYAHRVSYLVHHGAIPDGLKVRHTCDKPKCCNPAHLVLGTQGDNMRDAVTRNRHFSPIRDGGLDPRRVGRPVVDAAAIRAEYVREYEFTTRPQGGGAWRSNARELAETYGTTEKYVRDIVSNRKQPD